MKSLFLMLLRVYKLTISPFLGQNCRFYPSCSAYADIAIRRHGVLKGTLLAGKRVCKCHPWHPGGVDLVPDEAIHIEQESPVPMQSRLKLARFDHARLAGSADTCADASAEQSLHTLSKQASNQPYFTTE